ncbi:hypothetical protein [Streptomyces sp. NPDC059479]|uniref:hypothetical protein n=1 Tax=Streptomyces sp. NPDC059479 TaxID=3346848 RepID=UPI003693EDD6
MSWSNTSIRSPSSQLIHAMSDRVPAATGRTASTIRLSTSELRPTEMKFARLIRRAGRWSSMALGPPARFTAVFW